MPFGSLQTLKCWHFITFAQKIIATTTFEWKINSNNFCTETKSTGGKCDWMFLSSFTGITNVKSWFGLVWFYHQISLMTSGCWVIFDINTGFIFDMILIWYTGLVWWPVGVRRYLILTLVGLLSAAGDRGGYYGTHWEKWPNKE